MCELVWQSQDFSLPAQPVQDRAEGRSLDQDKAESPRQVRAGIKRDRNMIDILRLYLGFPQAPANRLDRETGPMFDSVKSFFLNGCDQLSVDHDSCRRIAMIGIYPQ